MILNAIENWIHRMFAGREVSIAGRDREQYRANSLRLEAYRQADFATATDGVLTQAFANAEGVLHRYVALVQRVASDGATQYVRGPRRRFEGLPTAGLDKLAAIYAASGIDAALREAQKKAIPQQSVLLTVDRGAGDTVRVRSWVPGEVEDVEWADPLEDRISEARAVVLTVPVGRTREGEVVYGRRVYTREKCYTEVRNGREVEQRPVFGTSTANPFPGGRLPLVVVRHETPVKGEAFPPVRLDLLAQQDALVIGLSDLINIAQNQCAGERVLIGSGAVRALQMLSEDDSVARSSDGVMAFDAIDGESLEYKIHNANPDLGGYQQTLDRLVELGTRFMYAQPEGLMGSTAITGAGKEAERLDLVEQRWRMEATWRQAESDLLRVICDVSNLPPNGLWLDPDKARVAVDHLYIRARQNDLQEAQARDILYARGLASAVEDIAEEEGLDEDEAALLWAKRLGRYRFGRERIGGLEPQGLDRVAEAADAAPGTVEAAPDNTAQRPAGEP